MDVGQENVDFFLPISHELLPGDVDFPAFHQHETNRRYTVEEPDQRERDGATVKLDPSNGNDILVCNGMVKYYTSKVSTHEIAELVVF